MCGFVGWVNHKKNLGNNMDHLIEMNKSLSCRGPDCTGYYFKKNILLGHQRLSVIDVENGSQPMTYKDYVIVYNGELYNTEKIRNILIDIGYTFKTNCDTEVVLKAYAHFKEKSLEMFEGMYAFAIYDGKKLFLARDRLGIKPLFYSKLNNNFIFSSEIKGILKSNIIKPIINKKSLQELLALGPSRTPGNGIFKYIYELKPAHYLIYKDNKVKIKRYWNVKNEEFTDTLEDSKKKIKKLLENSIKNQMVSDVGIATLLSGGLDSSIITAVCSLKMKKKNQKLDTYSVDYEDNTDFFTANNFQVSDDNKFIKLATNEFNTNHSYITISQEDLAKYLKESILARDFPGMADIDSSLYIFSTKIKVKNKVILSGEGADEIFGGYPWFYRKDLLNRKYFPWISDLKERNKLLKKNMRKKLKIEKYAKKQYKKTLKEVPKCKNKKEQKHKNLAYLNMNWFMSTLLERKDRMTMRASLEARVPFIDHHLVEYLWNVPWPYKYYNSMEKGLLRETFKDILPYDITYRKKNPYPKTHNPKYAEIVSNLLKERLKNKQSILYKIFNINKINELIETKGNSFTTPWFGQLMTGPQLIAYLYQFDIWAEEYKIILKV